MGFETLTSIFLLKKPIRENNTCQHMDKTVTNDIQNETHIVRKKKHIDIMKNLKFGVDLANNEQDTAIYILENFEETYGLPDTSSGRPYIS